MAGDSRPLGASRSGARAAHLSDPTKPPRRCHLRKAEPRPPFSVAQEHCTPQPRPRAATLVPEGRDSHGVGWCLLLRGPNTNSLTPAGRPVIRFNSDTDSPEPGRTPQVKGKVLRKTTPLQMPAAELGAARTSDRPTDHKRGVSRTPPGVTTRRSRSGNSPRTLLSPSYCQDITRQQPNVGTHACQGPRRKAPRPRPARPRARHTRVFQARSSSSFGPQKLPEVSFPRWPRGCAPSRLSPARRPASLAGPPLLHLRVQPQSPHEHKRRCG